jgi:DNA polymerase-3 subunit epsilon
VLGQGLFTAHNAPFDWRFVASELGRATGRRMDGRRLCTVRLSRLLLPHLPRRSLDNVAHHFGIDIESRHRAAGDAVATARVLLRLLQAAGDRGVETWTALERFLSPRGRSPRAKRHASPRWMDRDSSA